MDKAKIIDLIVKDNSYLNYCKKVCGGRDIYKDLYQYTVLYLLEMNDTKLISIYNTGGIRNYIGRIIYVNGNIPTSVFKKEYEGKIQIQDLDYERLQIKDENSDGLQNLMDEFDRELQKECNECIQKGIYPAAVKIYELYEEKGSYVEVSRATNIPYKTIQRYVHGTRKKIIDRLNGKNSNSNPV